MQSVLFAAQPNLRATVDEHEVVTATRWSAGAARPGGPGSSQIHLKRLSAVFDLTIGHVEREGSMVAAELIVQTPFASPLVDQARAALIAWAATLSYERVWFENDVVSLGPPLLGGRWSATCGHCGSCWTDATPDFWLGARRVGFFPPVCSLCSHPLPQYRPTVACDEGSLADEVAAPILVEEVASW